MIGIACPDDGRLTRFASGRADESEEATLAQHLSNCDCCAARLESLADPLLSDLRQAGRSSLTAADACEDAIARVLAADPAAMRPLGAGDVLGEYRLEESLGHGGMGAVFRACHLRLGKTVAVKVIRPGRLLNASAIERFDREMKAVGQIDHLNVIHATDAREVDGVQLLVMEFVDGITLAQLVRQHGPRPPREAFGLLRQAAHGLDHVHQRGLVHRDVKPSNLMRTHDGTVKLLDLGLALLPAADAPAESLSTVDADPSHTQTGQMLGTRHYMAPEQAADPHRADARADVDGLGATLWFLLTGATLPSDWAAREPLPGGLPRAVWHRFLAEDPADRFPGVNAAVAALDPRKWQRRATLAALVVLPLLAAGAWYAWSPNPQSPPDSPASGQLPMTKEEAVALQAAWAAHLNCEPLESHPVLHQTFALIPPGTVPLDAQFSVRITRPYYLATCEVTHAQFARFVAAQNYVTTVEASGMGGYYLDIKHKTNAGTFVTNRERIWKSPGHAQVLDHQPVTQVSWIDAQKYCDWLSTLDGGVYRLPTEAELAWAARAGDARNDWLVNADNPTPLGWYRRNCDQPQLVAKLPANPWGLHDMLGNVAELCGDFAGDRPAANSDDFRGPSRGDFRVIYGFSHLSPNFKYFMRDRGRPDEAFGHVGFRVLREIP